MEPQAHDDATLSFYAREAQAYAANGWDGLNHDLTVFLNRLPPRARILELGCGSGRDAAAMIARGFDVDATDGSPAMAREAATRVGNAVRVMRFDALRAEGEYDAVWANNSLLHVPRVALIPILTRVYRALKPGGHHFASYKGGTREGRDMLGRYFNYPTLEYLRAAYQAAGAWAAFDIETSSGTGYDKRVTPLMAVRAVRR